MNHRQKELLKILLRQKESTNISDLCNQLKCSEKTVRNDLNQMEEILTAYPSAQLVRKPGIGISLKIDELDRSRIFQSLFSNEMKSTEDRFVEIAYQLLISDKSITIKELVNRYYVPIGLIKKDLDRIEKWVEKYGLELVSKPRIGNTIEGMELNKRSALAHLSELLSTDQEKNYVLDLFLPYEVSTVQRALLDLQQQYDMSFTDGAMESLLIHALIMVKRTRQKSPVFIPEEESESIYRYKEYEHALSFSNKLESVFRISFPEEERIYFTWHLISGKKREDESLDVFLSDEYLMNVITDLTLKIDKLTLFTFEMDTVLIKGLAVHIYSVINRIKYGFPLTNPLLSEIKRMYPYMFNMVMLSLNEINEKYHLDIPEDEAAYLVLHFQASIERLEGIREKKKQALIVCHLGVGISHLLEAKLKHHYQNIKIVGCISKKEVAESLRHEEVDFIITTVPINQNNVPQVVISPLLEESDKEKLSQFVVELDDKEKDNDVSGRLTKLVRGDMVYLQLEESHPFKVVESLGDVLFQKGLVNETFTHNALVRERKSATSIGGGVAIPHGNPEMVYQSAIAVAVLDKPIEWGSELVSVVFMLAIANQDRKLNRGAVAEIAAISEDPAHLNALIGARSVEGFLNNINSKE
ncbi:BglG family transcription antiterminator [Aquibacillus saliphilus]|uniref:BglG family transcription antiterminator n=1 Tax=Aquibacillus saliphilus TaxID=1909422 RepID=UPI001CF04BC0|nr:BglG family transcription antiterminator [Aquibacillus saliphilus]